MHYLTENKKVQCVKGSYYVYLPKIWCDQYISHEQREVAIKRLEDDTLLIIPHDRKIDVHTELKIIIEKNQSIEYILNTILTAYIIGVNKIIVEMLQKDRIPLEFQSKIATFTKGLLGFSVVEQDPTHIEIRDLSQSGEIKATMKQMLAKVGLVFDSFLEILEKQKEDFRDQLKMLISQDDIVDEYRYQIDRQTHLLLQHPSLSQQIKVTPIECLHYAQSARSLERIADHLGKVASQILVAEGEGNKVSPDTLPLLRKAYTFYNWVVDLFYRSNTVEMHAKLVEMKKYSLDDKLVGAGDANEKQVYLHIDRIIHHCADILEIRINSAIFMRLV